MSFLSVPRYGRRWPTVGPTGRFSNDLEVQEIDRTFGNYLHRYGPLAAFSEDMCPDCLELAPLALFDYIDQTICDFDQLYRRLCVPGADVHYCRTSPFFDRREAYMYAYSQQAEPSLKEFTGEDRLKDARAVREGRLWNIYECINAARVCQRAISVGRCPACQKEFVEKAGKYLSRAMLETILYAQEMGPDYSFWFATPELRKWYAEHAGVPEMANEKEAVAHG